MKKSTGFLIVCAIMASLFSGMLTVSAIEANSYFTFNDAQLAAKYADDSGNSVLGKVTLNTDTNYTYGNAMYSGLLDLSNGNKWGTDKASLTKMGMTTDWSGYDVLRVRYYSTIQDAYYSIFLSDTTSQSNRYRFTVYADKVGWNVAEIDFNTLKKTGSPSLSNINYIQIRTDNNSDSTGGSSAQIGSGATAGLKFYFDKMWLEKYEETGARSYISFVDNATTIANWKKADGTVGNGKLKTANGGFYGAAYSCYIDLGSNKWGTDQGCISALGMKTDWTEYDTMNLRFRSNISSQFFTVYLWCDDAYSAGYKVKITARKGDWYTAEIPLSSLTVAKGSPNLNSIKYIQIRTDNNNDGGQQCGSGATSNWKLFFDKLWITKSEIPALHEFKYVYANGEAIIKGIDALSAENQVSMVIPAEIDGNKVVKIDSDAFKGNTNIVNLTLPNTLKEISDNAFANCSKLLYITMPSCEKIGGSAFYGCTRLSVINSEYAGEVVFPKNLKEIKDGAFRNANVIRTVILPESIEKLGNVFYRTVGIKNIYFPETIPQDAYKKTFLGGSKDFNTVNAFGTKDSYIATYAKSEDAVDNSTADDYEKSGKKLYNYIEENSDILVMNSAVTVTESTVGFDARLFNVGDAAADLTAILAVYSEAGVLKGVKAVNNVNVPAYEGYSITDEVLAVTDIEVADKDTARVMFWEDLGSIKPIVTQNITFNLEVPENEEVTE